MRRAIFASVVAGVLGALAAWSAVRQREAALAWVAGDAFDTPWDDTPEWTL